MNKCLLLFAMMTLAFNALSNADPCRGLAFEFGSYDLKMVKPEIIKHLKKDVKGVDSITIVDAIHLGWWEILKVRTKVSDGAYLFYSNSPRKGPYVAMWGRVATANEADDIEKWVLENAKGIPVQLARCFSKKVTSGK